MTGGAQLAATLAFQPDWWEVMTAPFMRNALLGGTIVALMAGMLGYFVIVRSSSFAAHALAHIGFPGATGAILVGVPVTLGLAVFCIGGGLAIGALGKRASEREIATGTVLAFATGLGVLFASMATRGASAVTNVLFGNLLAVTTGQLWVFAGFAVGHRRRRRARLPAAALRQHRRRGRRGARACRSAPSGSSSWCCWRW